MGGAGELQCDPYHLQLEMRRMNGVLEYLAKQMTATVKAQHDSTAAVTAALAKLVRNSPFSPPPQGGSIHNQCTDKFRQFAPVIGLLDSSCKP